MFKSVEDLGIDVRNQTNNFRPKKPLVNVHEFACVGDSAPQQNEDDFKRIIQNMEVQTNQTVFETVQPQISNLKLSDREICGLHEEVVWTDDHWGQYSLLDKKLLINSNLKFLYSVIQLGVFMETVTLILKQHEFVKKIESVVSLNARNIDHSTTSQENPWKTEECREAYMRTGGSTAPGMAPTRREVLPRQVQQERSLQSRFHSYWRSTIWKWSMET